MADGTKIEWTDATWNPITGCSVVSPGCTNCYAMKLAGTRLQHHESRIGLTEISKAGPVWNGQVRFNRQWLDQPLKWPAKKPRMIFVCAHGDLFHENVPDEWIDQVFAVMALAPQHTFQVLTKRADRMREYMTGDRTDVLDQAFEFVANREGDIAGLVVRENLENGPWPLPNVWLGVSAEDQQRADERIPLLLQTPAAVRWISAEPLLGPISFRWKPYAYQATGETYREYMDRNGRMSHLESLNGIDWVVAGGESGPGSRPAHPDWFRSLRDQCAAAGVPYFFKQWGDWYPGELVLEEAEGIVAFPSVDHNPDAETLDGRFRYHEFADTEGMLRVGKKRAGNLLDGRQHQEWPQ